mgnify:CR=1 FL=1
MRTKEPILAPLLLNMAIASEYGGARVSLKRISVDRFREKTILESLHLLFLRFSDDL